MTRATLLPFLMLVPAAVTVAVGCGSASPSEEGSTALGTLSGSVALAAYSLDNPVVIARTPSGDAYVAPITSDGRFHLALPADQRYGVILATTLRNGSYRAVSEIRWGQERASWGRFKGADTSIELGVVHPVGVAASTIKLASQGSSIDGTCGCAEASGGSGSGSSRDGSGSGSDEKSEKSEKSEESEESEGDAPSCYKAGKADLPYDVRPGVGDTFRLVDAFLAKGAPPKAILAVTMEGGSWRLTELLHNTPFTVTQADCDHAGNRDTGRDRIDVTWSNADGSVETDHLDMRYCKGGGGSGAASGSSSSAASGLCNAEDAPVCGDGAIGVSECDGESMHSDPEAASPLPPCESEPPGDGGAGDANGSAAPAPSPDGGITTVTNGTTDGPPACVTSAECGAGLGCFASTCSPLVQ